MFTYELTDGALSDYSTVTVTVVAMNDAPVAGDVTVTMGEDTVVTMNPIDDSTDADDDVLTVTATTPAPNATVILNPAGDVTITPDPNWNGITSFDYTVSDGTVDATATVTLVVAAVNDAPNVTDDSAVTDEDVEVDIPVLDNDSDIDGDTLTIAAITSSGKGTAAIVGSSVRFTPKANWSGTDTITYTVTDGLITLPSSATITVTPVNDAPIAVDDKATTNEDSYVRIPALANDIDKDNGDRLRLVSVTPAGNGTSQVDGGKLRYTPDSNFNGTDSFTYTMRDSSWVTSTATVTVTVRPVNDLPVAAEDSATTDEDAAVQIDVLANDSDIDGDDLSVSVDAQPAVGTASVNSDQSITYTPQPDWNGVVSFTYLASDGVASVGATVTVTVNAVNDAPTANGDSLDLDEDTSAGLDPTSNDTDVDGDTLAVSAWSQPANGVVQKSGNQLTYVPDPDYFGSDAFSYTVTDGNGAFSAASIDVAVRPVDDAPLVSDVEISTPAGEPVTIVATGNVIDPDGDPLQIVAFSQGAFGTVTANADGTLTFTPNPEFVGTDEFMYIVSDGTTPQTARVILTREVDGAALVEISMTPAAPRDSDWVAAPRAADVVADEALSTVAVLAGPAAVAAAAAGFTVVAQSQGAARLVSRLGQRITRKP